MPAVRHLFRANCLSIEVLEKRNPKRILYFGELEDSATRRLGFVERVLAFGGHVVRGGLARVVCVSRGVFLSPEVNQHGIHRVLSVHHLISLLSARFRLGAVQARAGRRLLEVLFTDRFHRVAGAIVDGVKE